MVKSNKVVPKRRSRKGVPNKSTVMLRKARETMQETLEAVGIPEPFKGDAHAFMVSVYSNPLMPTDLRLDAAKAAAKFEKPTLAATEMKHTGADGKPLQLAPVINLTITAPKDDKGDE